MSFSFVVDVPWIERLAGAHRESGVGAVILHGAVHSYRRSESRAWGELMGAFSLRHDSQSRSRSKRSRPTISDHARRAGEVGDEQGRAVRARTGVADHDAAGPGVQRRIEEDLPLIWTNTHGKAACSSRHSDTTPK